MMKSKLIRLLLKALRADLFKQIFVGLLFGVALAALWPRGAAAVGVLGTLFVSALKGIAPILVLVLVVSSIANQSIKGESQVRPVILIYLFSTVVSAFSAVVASFLFPTTLTLDHVAGVEAAAPAVLDEVILTLLLNVVDNPLHAVVNANYIGILFWAIVFGLFFRKTGENTKAMLADAATVVGKAVQLVIHTAPIGIFGLVASTLAREGFAVMLEFGHLLAVLIGTMAFVALVLNPLIVFFCTHRNPYPLTYMCLRESGVSAFFMRSSAANIPTNLDICRRLNLPESTYAITIPVGSIINMAGAAVVITIMALSAAYSVGIEVSFASALFLSVVASVCAAGTSGVPGGSLMLIPLACGLFGIDQSIAMQVVAVGFIIGVLQDSTETALNSSSDVLFTIAACRRAERLEKAAQH